MRCARVSTYTRFLNCNELGDRADNGGFDATLLTQEATRYRYSPLVALLMLPNHYLFKEWGKVLFSAFDIV